MGEFINNLSLLEQTLTRLQRPMQPWLYHRCTSIWFRSQDVTADDPGWPCCWKYIKNYLPGTTICMGACRVSAQHWSRSQQQNIAAKGGYESCRLSRCRWVARAGDVRPAKAGRPGYRTSGSLVGSSISRGAAPYTASRSPQCRNIRFSRRTTLMRACVREGTAPYGIVLRKPSAACHPAVFPAAL